MKLTTYDYDRSKEPKNVKNKGSTIEWGMKNAIKNSKKPPDVIYHRGGFWKRANDHSIWRNSRHSHKKNSKNYLK